MSKKFFYLFSLIFLFAFCAEAAQMPRFLGTEKKFRSYIYNPNDVYRYIGHYSYQGFIEFEDGETIGTISMGNPALWMFEHLNNRLFLKPVGENGSETNMTVITNKRVYHFELLAREAKGINDKDLIFVAKFVYPDEKDKNILELPKMAASDEPDLRDLSIYNFNYQYTGEPSIAPIRVFDNGEFTYFQFNKKNAEIPAIFTVDSEGFESLINFRSAGSYIIVERVSPQFTLRSGSDIVCVYNTDLYNNGRLRRSTVKSLGEKPKTSSFSTPNNARSPYEAGGGSPVMLNSPTDPSLMSQSPSSSGGMSPMPRLPGQ